VEVQHIDFAGIHHKNITLLSRNYNRGKGATVHGVIGNRFWEAYTLEIDHAAKRLRFTSKQLSPNDPYVLPYQQAYVIPLRLGRQAVEARLDTGSPFTILMPLAHRETLAVSELVEAGRARSANTTFTFWTATCTDAIQLGHNTEQELDVVFSDLVGHVNIGMGLLQYYQLAINQQQQLIRLQRLAPANASD